ncbi:replication-associated protein [Human oral-associated vientovirus XM]|uniref:Replication-associated protein n=1 Tax=Human oral-associated vientovirus XM TaxID=2571091 RepID=A0A4D6K3G5_9VIRU|nr:replication-associated protein [Human oral-associated vientovirus XM]
MTLRLQHKNIYATYLDSEKKIFDPVILITELCERLDKYGIRYGIACKEVAPTTGTVHYHVLIMCNKTVSVRNAKNLLEIEGIMPHLEKINNNIIKVIQYIKKDGYYNEVNKENEPKTEKMNKADKAELMINGNWKELFMTGKLGAIDIIRAQKLKTIFDLNRPPKKYEQKLILWFYGETGEGKTRKAVETAEMYNLTYWLSNDSLRWFDGYQGQQIAIIDDFRKSMLTDWSYLLRILDGYSLYVQIKGGFTTWEPKIIIITSPATPQEAFKWIDKEGEERTWDKEEQLTRRLTFKEELQVYQFPLWKEEEKRLERTLRQFLGLPEEENMMPEEWSIIEPEGFITPS